MNTLLYVLHVLVALALIGGILLQPGAKGGGMGSVFGGGGANSAFGARGAAPVLAKLTYWLAACFMFTCLAIEILIIQHGRSVLDTAPVSAAPAPAQTETAPEQTGADASSEQPPAEPAPEPAGN
jgi:preprotein translocase subunit SecG